MAHIIQNIHEVLHLKALTHAREALYQLMSNFTYT